MIKISAKGLANFMTANAARQRKILRDFKYPEPEGQAQAIYYRGAGDIIVAYHKNNYQPHWLIERSQSLRALGDSVSGQARAKYQNNARAIALYAEHFGRKRFEVLRGVRLSRVYHGVRVTVVPDLHVMEKGREKFIKLDFTRSQPDPKVPKIIGQLLYDELSSRNDDLASGDILYLDVPRGRALKCARAGSRIEAEIEAACLNIAAIWQTM